MTSTPAPSTTPPLLDHHRFPHIVEAVMRHADLATKLAFRATSRKFLDKVDDTLFSHVLVALRPFPPCYGAVRDATFTIVQPFAPFARLPFLPWDRDTSPPTPREDIPTEADRAAFDPTDPDSYPFPPVSVRTDHRRRQMARVRLLDYHPFRGGLAVKLGSLLTNVRVIRKRRPLPSAVRAPTAVDYLNITSPYCHRSGHVPWARFGAPSRASRYVLHISFDPSHPALHEAPIYVDLSDVSDLVIVFAPQLVAPVPGVVIGPPAYGGLPRLGMLGGLMRSIAHTMWDVRDKAKIELVGLERVPPGYLNLDSSLQGEGVFEAVNKEFFAMAEAWIETLRGANDMYKEALSLRVFTSVVKYTTLEQWCASAPEEERNPCPMLPDVNEDLRDYVEWSDGSRLMDTSLLPPEGNDDDLDYLPHDPWFSTVSEQGMAWMEQHT